MSETYKSNFSKSSIFDILNDIFNTYKIKEYPEEKNEHLKKFNIEEWCKTEYPVVTRNGNTVQILRDNLRGNYPILALVVENNVDVPILTTKTGESPYDSRYDLFFKLPEPTKKYAGIYLTDKGEIKQYPWVDSFDGANAEIPGYKLLKVIDIEL